MKKLLAVAAAGAMLVSVVVPALARGHRGPDLSRMSADVAIVDNSATAVANTGVNMQGNTGLGGKNDVTVSGNNTMETGDADAYAGAVVVANTHVDCCPQSCGPVCDADIQGGHRRGDSRCPCPHIDYANVTNAATAGANTGDNLQGNLGAAGGVELASQGHRGHRHGDVTVSGNNNMTTGEATSRARAWVVVNSHLSR